MTVAQSPTTIPFRLSISSTQGLLHTVKMPVSDYYILGVAFSLLVFYFRGEFNGLFL